ncbi:MAG: ROK family protein [Actinomycetales bacterium]
MSSPNPREWFSRARGLRRQDPCAAPAAGEPDERLSIGVDIGGTKVVAGVVDAGGHILDTRRRATPGRDVRAVEDTIVEVVQELADAASGPLCAVGVGAAGFVSADGSTVLFSPHLAWRREPLRDRLTQRLERTVLVDNDANGAGWAEYRFGVGRGQSRLVCITLGTGIGGALVFDGRLDRGLNGMAGEFGHMIIMPGGHRCECGNRGCWEQYASGNALGREARELAVSGSPMGKDLLARAGGDPSLIVGALVTEAARDGDPAAVELFIEVGHWLGVGLANICAALDPSMFVIGGGVSDAGDLLLTSAREALARNLTGRGFRPVPEVLVAEQGPLANVIGMADLARLAVEAPPR